MITLRLRAIAAVQCRRMRGIADRKTPTTYNEGEMAMRTIRAMTAALLVLAACADNGDALDIVTCGDRWPGAGKSHCARACNAPEPDSLPANGCAVTADGGIHIDCPLDRLAQWDGEYGCCAIPEPVPGGGTYLTWLPCE